QRVDRLLDRQLALGGIAEGPAGEDRLDLEGLAKTIEVGDLDAALVEQPLGAGADGYLRLVEHLRKPSRNALEGELLLLAVDAAHHRHPALGEVAGADDNAQRDAAQLPIGVLLAGTDAIATVDAQPDPCGASRSSR